MKERILFRPSGKKFVFNFNSGSCFNVATGTCLFDASEDFIKENKNLPGKDIANRCFTIFDLMKEHKLLAPEVVEYKCGHLGSGDGQHRLCIAAKNGMQIKVDYYKASEDSCDWCNNPNASENCYFLHNG